MSVVAAEAAGDTSSPFSGIVLVYARVLGHTGNVQTTRDHEQELRAASLRVTRPRLAVLAAVHQHPHADTESIIAAVRETVPDVSHQTVYDSLRTLHEVGLVRRIQPAGTLARYEARVGDNHHHLVCRQCNAIVDVDCARGEVPCLDPDDDHGFHVDEAEVIYWGLCPSCAASSAPPDSSST